MIEDPAARLLAEADLRRPAAPSGRLLLIEGGPGPLLERFASSFAEVVCQNGFAPDHAAARATVARLRLDHVTCLLTDIPRVLGTPAGQALEGPLASPVFPEGHFDCVLFRLGRGTALVNAALLQAFALLREGGSLFVSGHTREGIKSFAKRAEDVFGNLAVETIKSSCRLLRCDKTSARPARPIPDPHYFLPVRLLLHNPSAIEYLSKPGIFAYRETDPATALLARHLPACAGQRVLDFGCGSGVLSLAAFRLGASDVTAVDFSAAAAACAERNFAEQGVPGRVLCADMTEGVTGLYDLILSNPPFHRGAETDYSLPGTILDALRPLLKPQGRLFLVANQFLDYMKEGRRRFETVELLARERGYQVYRMTAA